MCAVGEACTSAARGHALHLIQDRLASATPAAWVDALVEEVDAAVYGVLAARGGRRNVARVA
jgi:hypothetical protein